MAAAGWQATVETYLGRVTKARILAAVGEARGDDAARRLEGMKKGEMAETAESLLAGSGWLPEPLRTPGRSGRDASTTAPPWRPTVSRRRRRCGDRRVNAPRRPAATRTPDAFGTRGGDGADAASTILPTIPTASADGDAAPLAAAE